MRQLQIVMPMAGHARRFKEAGISQAKPLIVWKTRTLMEHALASVETFRSNARLITVVKRQDGIEVAIAKIAAGWAKDSRSCVLERPTRSPVETVLSARESISSDAPLLLLDCDLTFRAPEFEKQIQTLLENAHDADGVLCTFPSHDPAFSYIETSGPAVCSMMEKKVISSKAVAGAYFFSRAETFLNIADDFDFGAGSEVYVSHVIQKLLDAGKKFLWAPSESHTSLGTPLDLES